MPLADIDDLGVAEWVSILATVATLLLALFTWRLARATKKMADSSDEQLALLWRQATAAETTVAQRQVTIEATMEPRLRLVRTQGQELAVIDRGRMWGVTVRSESPVPATIEGATLGTQPAVMLAAAPPGPLQQGDTALLSCDDVADNVVASLQAAKAVDLTIRYEGPAGKPRHTRLQIRHKASPDRWIVVEKESDAGHGGGSAQW